MGKPNSGFSDLQKYCAGGTDSMADSPPMHQQEDLPWLWISGITCAGPTVLFLRYRRKTERKDCNPLVLILTSLRKYYITTLGERLKGTVPLKLCG